MSSYADLLIRTDVEPADGYREGVLRDASQDSTGRVTLTIEDKQTGTQTQLQTKSIPSMWGRHKRKLPQDVVDEVSTDPPNPMDLEAMATALLDTRTSGLRFYYYAPNTDLNFDAAPADD